eukprot:scaffold894_cov118-Skeletonema_menzelii.AAC.3
MVADQRDPALSARGSSEESVARDVASITRAKLARRHRQQHYRQRPYSASGGDNMKPPQSMPRKPGGPEFPDIGWGEIPSLLSNASNLSNDTYDTMDQNTMETALFKKFEEAFNITLRNNPGILPGAPTVIESIKTAMFKVQKSKAIREVEMKNQLDRLKGELSSLEQQLSQQMGSMAMRKGNLTKQLEEAERNELRTKMDGVANEKMDLVKNLELLSKSRIELEKSLDKEMKIVESQKDALQKIINEKKRLQKRREENKELEDKVEKMTEAASKEKKALQDEMEEHKKFMKHIATLREEKEEAMKALEEEKKEILESTQTMQAKKTALIESKAELENQYQLEIDELENDLAGTKMNHDKRKEQVVKKKVMSYLRQSGHDVENRRGKKLGEKDIEAMVNAKVESELKKKGRNLVDGDSSDDDDYSTDSYEDRRDSSTRSRKGEMKLEIEILRRELDVARASTPRGGATPRSSTLESGLPRSPYLHTEPAYFASPRASGRTPRFSSGNRSRFDSFDDEDRHGDFATGLRSPRTPFSRASPSSRTPRSLASPRHYF